MWKGHSNTQLLITDNYGVWFYITLLYLRFRSEKASEIFGRKPQHWFSGMGEKNLVECNGTLKASSLGLPVSSFH